MSNWWTSRLESPVSPPSLPKTSLDPALRPPVTQRPEVPVPPSLAPKRPEEHCPSCYSSHYMAATPNSQKRCYDCGYPIQQSGSGVGSTRSDAPSKQATQVAGGGFNPTTIIGSVK